jgi:PTH2 family peptidyl-tRNA hydrolase
MELVMANLKQYIVVDRSLHMSHGKMAAQVAHASMAFLTRMIQESVGSADATSDNSYQCCLTLRKELYDDWINGIFTKVILAAKTSNDMLRIIEKANAAGLEEDKDYFCIRDACLTELSPDETGTRWTAIGFVPMADSAMKPIVGKLQVYRDQNHYKA